MNKPAAWIMNIDNAFFASVSQMEIVHIINNPDYIRIPKAPSYCRNVIIWNEHLLPVIDLSCLINNAQYNAEMNVIAVVTYRNSNNKILYGGIALEKSPSLEFVTNSQVCELPKTIGKLHEISLSCFESNDGNKVPILDLSRVFSRDLSLSYSEACC